MMTTRAGLNAPALFVLLIFTGIACQRTNMPVADAELPGSIKTKGGLEMILVPAGSFDMGNKRGKEDAAVVHKVTVDGFLMDKYEVTQAEYEKQGLPNPSHFKGPELPVEQISWAQAALYCNRRSQAEGLKPCYDEATAKCNFEADGYRLPTEAEWEYACRAGSTTDYCFGSDARKLTEYAWFTDNSSKKTHPVGQKKPNPWGLYDMHGNVAEWCNDFYRPDWYKQFTGKTVKASEVTNWPTELYPRIIRGGSYHADPEECRSAFRYASAANLNVKDPQL